MRRSKGNYCIYTWEHFISCCNWANIITGKKYPTFLLIPRPADNHLKRVILESSFSDWFLLRRWKQFGVMMFYLKGRQYFVHKYKLPQGPGKLHLWPFFFFLWVDQAEDAGGCSASVAVLCHSSAWQAVGVRHGLLLFIRKQSYSGKRGFYNFLPCAKKRIVSSLWGCLI